jgi:O-antigen biosynthesis protein
MELSIIIVSFNVRDYLKQCLQSVGKASEKTDCEIFVVDNNSSDDSCAMIEQEFPYIILIRNITNTGFSAANNKAIKLAKGRYILLLNPDTIVNDDTLVKCIRFMDLHPDAGASGVRMINGEGRFLPESKRSLPTVGTAFFKTFGLSYLFPNSKIFSRYYLTHIDSLNTSKTEVISGAFMLVRREALTKSGLLDEDFFMYGEDIDLSYRLLKSGYNNYYYAGTQITHFKGKSTDRKGFNDILHFYKAMRIYVRKRAGEGKYKSWYLLVLPGIYLREALAILNRMIRIIISP